MSIEAALAANTEALKANTAAILGRAAPAAGKADAAAPKADPKKAKVTEAQVAEKAGALKDAQGIAVVRALVKKHGGESGKIADVPKTAFAAFVADVDAALAGDEAESAEDDDSL